MNARVDFATPTNVTVSLENGKWHINDRACRDKNEAEKVIKELALTAGAEEPLAQDQAREAVNLVAFISKHKDWYRRIRYE